MAWFDRIFDESSTFSPTRDVYRLIRESEEARCNRELLETGEADIESWGPYCPNCEGHIPESPANCVCGVCNLCNRGGGEVEIANRYVESAFFSVHNLDFSLSISGIAPRESTLSNRRSSHKV